jgi:2'-hydroxyisoflavone reductase
MSNILILGGTQFLGRSFIENLLEIKKYKITICNRGISNPQLFPDLNKIIYDRNIDTGCEKLFDDFYDFVFDFSAYQERQLSSVSKYIRCHKYIFISSIAVIRQQIDSEMQNYANNKISCESFIKKTYLNHCIVRPTYVVGDYDYTNRFYKKDNEFYWINSEIKLNDFITIDQLNKILLNEIDFSNVQKVINCEKIEV